VDDDVFAFRFPFLSQPINEWSESRKSSLSKKSFGTISHTSMDKKIIKKLDFRKNACVDGNQIKLRRQFEERFCYNEKIFKIVVLGFMVNSFSNFCLGDPSDDCIREVENILLKPLEDYKTPAEVAEDLQLLQRA
jgi:hypothetical protein